jgi:hypothetical protein
MRITRNLSLQVVTELLKESLTNSVIKRNSLILTMMRVSEKLAKWRMKQVLKITEFFS